MKIIDKIEIKHFRSFDGGKDKDKIRIEKLNDLNIFSGANDSGKSNVLRALNLFFNNEISPGKPFVLERDFSKIVEKRFDDVLLSRKAEDAERVKQIIATGGHAEAKELRKSDIVVSIKLHFNNREKRWGLPEKFWIARIYSKRNNFKGSYDYSKEIKGTPNASRFVNYFKFEYVPAIKDRDFFNYLFKKLQNYLFEKEDKKKKNKFKTSSESFNNILKNETQGLFDKFLESTGVEANFHIPSTLVDFFRTLSVQTENEVSLFDRGDGVQARFIPEILDEISKDSKKYIIWGFEEPENSYELKNIRKLKEDFQKMYSRKKQIFITTHSSELLSVNREYTEQELRIINNKKNSRKAIEQKVQKLNLKNRSSATSIYRVWKDKDNSNSSKVTRFDETKQQWEEICDDLGIIDESRIIGDLYKTLDMQSQELEKSGLSYSQQLRINKELTDKMKECLERLSNIQDKIDEYSKPILYVEDKHTDIYKVAFLKINGIEFNSDNLEQVFFNNSHFVIRRGESAGKLSGRFRAPNCDGDEEKRIVGLFDFDKEGREQYHCLSKEGFWKKPQEGDKKQGFYKTREDHDCFYAMLLPIPDRLSNLADLAWENYASYVEIENLLPIDFLTTNNFAEEKNNPGGPYYKIKDDKKRQLRKEIIELSKEDFNDFIPIFDLFDKLTGYE